jgi:hypothetical protein
MNLLPEEWLYRRQTNSNKPLQQTGPVLRLFMVYCLFGRPGCWAVAFGCDTKSLG